MTSILFGYSPYEPRKSICLSQATQRLHSVNTSVGGWFKLSLRREASYLDQCSRARWPSEGTWNGPRHKSPFGAFCAATTDGSWSNDGSPTRRNVSCAPPNKKKGEKGNKSLEMNSRNPPSRNRQRKKNISDRWLARTMTDASRISRRRPVVVAEGMWRWIYYFPIRRGPCLW